MQNLSPYLQEYDYHLYPRSLRGSWQQNLPLQYDGVVHLAGKAHDTANVSDPEEYFQVNTELTRQLFDKFLQSPARGFIYFSSAMWSATRNQKTPSASKSFRSPAARAW